MPEHQNIEYKSSWHDDCLKWICGFANAQGRRIYIGKNDAGVVVGAEDYKKLMDEAPNKIKNHMGIIAKVNLLQDNDRHFVKIIVLFYFVAISLHSRYYYRSGSVKQELTCAALNEFLLKRAGQIWDDVIEKTRTVDKVESDSYSADESFNRGGRQENIEVK
jgi:ATP-dependent DNA helicase RecG